MQVLKKRLKLTLLVTTIAINLMIGTLILGRYYWSLPLASPASSYLNTNQPQITSRYVMQFVSTDEFRDKNRKGGKWRVEHYREYEYRYHPNGEVIDRIPTSKEEHIRYWMSDPKN
ncbi:hypothetical protein SAMN05444392_101157 [Seinonella peptonophila]|uniref:Uncharacterized protein n=1 Tax=Seinonella peptonophila TaxID=112248 RepID=A0A1M4SV63_9BACL|nr:hypothetical protein [Seinonella peptonophila]SHE36088.1 hypothetical protein SAMN05444392_101157 [Seinonella peptonophila]